jgi:BirA family biotin operon repressor/biotin-[acetyl-CoA-carboxylase] ligase
MNSHTFPILRLLADGRFHSGEAIAEHLGVTRATVWNALRDAEMLGVQLFSVRGRGYRLPDPVCFLDKEQVLQALGDHRETFSLEFHDRIESTNSHLMQQAGSAPNGTCVAAELQTAGRGRRGRAWHAGLGSSLTFSLLWRFECGAGGLSGLSLAVGVALMRALRELGADDALLKWPNDVLHRGRKLAGILIELQGDMDGPSAAVIGIGLNLRLREALRDSIDQPVCDLHGILGQAVSPNALLGALLRHLAEVMGAFEQEGFAVLQEEWAVHHAFQDQAVRMLMPDGQEICGVARGVATDGSLLMETGQGIRRFSSGEISMRGMA